MGVKESFTEELTFELDPKESTGAKSLRAKNYAQGMRTHGSSRHVCVAGGFAMKQGEMGIAAAKLWTLPSSPASFGVFCPLLSYVPARRAFTCLPKEPTHPHTYSS